MTKPVGWNQYNIREPTCAKSELCIEITYKPLKIEDYDDEEEEGDKAIQGIVDKMISKD